jgi:CO/xanthine dehydrogenase FAD-binding subunit
MDAQHINQIFLPLSLTELFSSWTRFPNAIPFAGGTSFASEKGTKLMDIPGNILSLEKIEELHKITRTERYLEIGSMVRLNDLIKVGKIVPEVLRNTIKHIANTPLRNLATIGGNICYAKQKLDTHAPLSALDAMFELRSASSTRWIAASRFDTEDDPTLRLNPQELLTRIRIPLDTWDYVIMKKLERNHFSDSGKGVIVFIAKAQKNMISDVRLVIAGESLIRNRNFETLLSGKQLPLDGKTASHFVDLWEQYLKTIPFADELFAAKIVNVIRLAMQDLRN